MQKEIITIQVANKYQYTPTAQFLLLTSYGVAKETLRAWTGVLESQLHATADIWIVSQHGTLMLQQGRYEIVLSPSKDKTILCLDHEPFNFCGKGTRGVMDLVSLRHALPHNGNGTPFLVAKIGRASRRGASGKTVRISRSHQPAPATKHMQSVVRTNFAA